MASAPEVVEMWGVVSLGHFIRPTKCPTCGSESIREWDLTDSSDDGKSGDLWLPTEYLCRDCHNSINPEKVTP